MGEIEVNFEKGSGRKCGDCTLCCKLLPIPEINKKALTKCVQQSVHGCKVYRKPGSFPISCASWSCMWLIDPSFKGMRPDRTGYVVDMMPDLVRFGPTDSGKIGEMVCVQVWCDPAKPDAWKDDALFRYAESRGTGVPILVRYGSEKALLVLPPAISPTGQAVAIDSGVEAPSVTGSLLLDKLNNLEGLGD